MIPPHKLPMELPDCPLGFRELPLYFVTAHYLTEAQHRELTGLLRSKGITYSGGYENGQPSQPDKGELK